MPNLAAVMKQEIARIARRETRSLTKVTRRAATQHRRDIAALKRMIGQLARKLGFLEKQEERRLKKLPGALAAAGRLDDGKQLRYSHLWLKKHRAKLDLSAKDYGKLVGVTQLTVYNWETGKSKPRRSQLLKLASIRQLRKREALKRLEVIG